MSREGGQVQWAAAAVAASVPERMQAGMPTP